MEHQLEVFEQLREVFDSCDHDSDGYVKIEDLINLGRDHRDEANAEELEVILRNLDLDGTGLIRFDVFCDRVSQCFPKAEVADEAPILKGEPKEPFRLRSYTDSEGFFDGNDSTSHSTTSTNDFGGDLDEPLVAAFRRSCSEALSSKKHSRIYSTYPPTGVRKHKRHYPALFQDRKLLSRTSELRSQELEEGFEGYGEAIEDEHIYHSDYDSSPISKPSLLKRISGSAVARRSLRYAQSADCSLETSLEELSLPFHSSFNDNDNSIVMLSDQLQQLSSQVNHLQSDQADQEGRQNKLRDENRNLITRINALEEQLEHQKSVTIDAVEEESEKYKVVLTRLQRDNDERLSDVQTKLEKAEYEINSLKDVEPMLRKELESCLEERRIIQQKSEELHLEILEKEREIGLLRLKLKQKEDNFAAEKAALIQEISSLNEELQSFRYLSIGANESAAEKKELSKQIRELQEENVRLCQSREDLRVQLLENKDQFTKRESLADELLAADKTEVVEAVQVLEEENYRMKQYIEQLLYIIMEANPMLLEK